MYRHLWMYGRYSVDDDKTSMEMRKIFRNVSDKIVIAVEVC